MKLYMCCCRDVRADMYMNPFFVDALGRAERQFEDEVNREGLDNPLFQHPEDFELYFIGSWDSNTCKFTLLESPERIKHGPQCVKAKLNDKRQMPLTGVN